MRKTFGLFAIFFISNIGNAKPSDSYAGLMKSTKYVVRVRAITSLKGERIESFYCAFVLPSALVSGHTRRNVWYLITAADNVTDGEEFVSIDVFARKAAVRHERGGAAGKWFSRSKHYRAEYVGVDRVNNVLILRIHPKEHSFRLQTRDFPKIVSREAFKEDPLMEKSTVYTLGTVGDNPSKVTFAATEGVVLLPDNPENHRNSGEVLWKASHPEGPAFQWPQANGANYWNTLAEAYRVYHSCKIDRSSIGSPLLRLRRVGRKFEPEVVGVNLRWSRTGGRTTSNQVYAIPMHDLFKVVTRTLFMSEEHRKLLTEKKQEELKASLVR